MDAKLRGLISKSCAVCIDDVIIYEGQTVPENLNAIEQEFIRLKKANLKLKTLNSQFTKRHIKFLGHIISAEGIKTDPDKINTVKTYSVLKNVKNLRAYISLSNFYRKFIFLYSHVVSPLNALLKKDMPLVWSNKCQSAYEKLEDALTTIPMLKYLDLNTPFKLCSNASRFSVGAVLAQEHDEKELVAAFAGLSLNSSERNYGITDKECVAFVYAVKHFQFTYVMLHFMHLVITKLSSH